MATMEGFNNTDATKQVKDAQGIGSGGINSRSANVFGQTVTMATKGGNIGAQWNGQYFADGQLKFMNEKGDSAWVNSQPYFNGPGHFYTPAGPIRILTNPGQR